ncbi:MAG: hypothetical protein ABJE66_35300 [Deltaproteobacteria bacterium]
MRILVVMLLLAACTDHADIVTVGQLQDVLVMPAIPNHDLDVLFMVDDSPSMLDKQESLRTSFPTMMDQLALLPDGLPNLHVGVITSDMGTSELDGRAAPSIGGSAQGGCSGTGKGGALETFDTTTITGKFISDVAGATGRDRNYTGELRDAFSVIANAGANGCGFEQPLASIRAAVSPGNTANAGFLRDEANLAVVILSDEDDCSMAESTLLTADTSTLGPLQSFRCTRFGVTCDEGGTTTDAMNQVGPKTACHQNTNAPYLADVHALAHELQARKADPSQVMVAAIVGDPTPVEVELRAPSGSTTPMPSLAHSCSYAGNDGPAVADPAVRLADFVADFGSRGALESVCNADLTLPLTQIGISTRQMMGDGCLAVRLADTRSDLVGVQPMCEVTDGDTELPSCTTAGAGQDCWLAIGDPNRCPDSPDNLRIEIDRTAVQVTQRYAHVKCLTAE